MYIVLKQNGNDWQEVVATDCWKDAIDFCYDLGEMRGIFEDEFQSFNLPVNTEFAFIQRDFPGNIYIVILHERWSSWKEDDYYYDRHCDYWAYDDEDPINDYYHQRAEDQFWRSLFCNVDKMMAEYAPKPAKNALADRKNIWYTGVLLDL